MAPGDEGRHGLVDVLAGDVDAGGRLPVSLLRTVGQVGVYAGHHHGGGRSLIYGDYIDGPVAPLFPFGHGLSYTTWSYDDVAVVAGIDRPRTSRSTSTLTNTGDRDGEEVVQVYARDEVASVGVPARRLVAFQRVAAGAGETVRVRFTMPAGRLGFHGADLRFRVEPGEVTFLVGPTSTTVTLTGEVEHPDPTAWHLSAAPSFLTVSIETAGHVPTAPRCILYDCKAALREGTMPWEATTIRPRCRVICDNDYSGDPDGLVQLAHHLLSPSIELRLIIGSRQAAIKLAGGAPDTTAKESETSARRIAELAGRTDVPIVTGARHPLRDRTTPASRGDRRPDRRGPTRRHQPPPVRHLRWRPHRHRLGVARRAPHRRAPHAHLDRWRRAPRPHHPARDGRRRIQHPNRPGGGAGRLQRLGPPDLAGAPNAYVQVLASRRRC